MRLPLYKVYRAFPELDQFSDDECRRYLANVQLDSQYKRQNGLFVLGAVVVVVPLIYGTLRVLRPLLRLIGDGGVVIVIWGIVLGIGVPLLVIRDRMLHRAIAARLVSATCRGCRYSLLGLTMNDGAVRCPECGEQIVLAEHNLTEADLLVRRDAPSNGPEGSA